MNYLDLSFEECQIELSLWYLLYIINEYSD